MTITPTLATLIVVFCDIIMLGIIISIAGHKGIVPRPLDTTYVFVIQWILVAAYISFSPLGATVVSLSGLLLISIYNFMRLLSVIILLGRSSGNIPVTLVQFLEYGSSVVLAMGGLAFMYGAINNFTANISTYVAVFVGLACIVVGVESTVHKTHRTMFNIAYFQALFDNNKT